MPGDIRSGAGIPRGKDYFLPEDSGWLHGRRAFDDFDDGLEGG